jgi:hypothetical protein
VRAGEGDGDGVGVTGARSATEMMIGCADGAATMLVIAESLVVRRGIAVPAPYNAAAPASSAQNARLVDEEGIHQRYRRGRTNWSN